MKDKVYIESRYQIIDLDIISLIINTMNSEDMKKRLSDVIGNEAEFSISKNILESSNKIGLLRLGDNWIIRNPIRIVNNE